MGKILVVSLCIFSVVVCVLSNPNPNLNSNSNTNRRENEIPKELEKKMEDLEKFHEEFKDFKKSLIQLSSAFSQFFQSLNKNGTGSAEGTQDYRRGKNTVSPSNPGSISSCSVAMEILSSPRSKKQTIYPHGNSTRMEVLCDFDVDGGGWTIIQQRLSGPKEEFYQNWNSYQNGFGSLSGNFWLGLDNIHTLTKNGDQELRIELEDFDGNKAYSKYSSFSISSASDFYRLSIGGYHGNSTAGDSMISSYNINGMPFSTKDSDNDGGDKNCAQLRQGAWWYRNVERACTHSNLNGYYWQLGQSFDPGQGLVWESWRGATTPLKKVQMKIRKRN